MIGPALLVVASLMFAPGATAKIGPADPNPYDPGPWAAVDPTLDELVAMVAGGGRGSSGGSGGGSGPKCVWTLAVDYFAFGQPLAHTEREDPDGTKAVLYMRECAGLAPALVWVRQASPQELAAIAVDMVRDRLPAPQGLFSPKLNPDAAPVVHLPLWFAVSGGQWAPVSATAAIPGLSATVTAQPTQLVFEPGDGAAAVSCAGPGPVFRPGMAEPATPPACSYTYGDASSVAPDGHGWPASLSIQWEVTWSASSGAGGSLGPLTTATGYAVPVREIQAIEQAGAR
jgi:hypothetical protein